VRSSTGQKARATTTIVEVQNRSSRVDITIFGGWVEKLKQVGAQQLFCVSHHDFPDSVKEEAFKLGGTVKLITLKELDADAIPINVGFEYNEFNVEGLKPPSVGIPELEAAPFGGLDALLKKLKDTPLEGKNRCFSLDKNELVSLYTLCKNYVGPLDGEDKGEGKLTFDDKEDPELYLFFEGHFLRVKFDYVFQWSYEKTQIPMSVLSYEQNEAGVLAWYVEVSYNSPKGLICSKVPCIKADKGFMIDNALIKLPPEVDLSVKAYYKME
jgi:hypothetical protein